MKIIGLKISGLRKLSAAELIIKKNGLTPIKGANKAGKTSVLDALEILFQGNTHVEKDMISHGAEKMTIEGELEDTNGDRYFVKKVVTEKSARLEIMDSKGFKLGKEPQKFLSDLISDLSFNPRHFLEKDGDRKLKDMMELLKIDFTSFDSKIKMKEQDRLLVGRELKSFGDVSLGEDVAKVDVGEILLQKKKISEENAQLKLNYEKQCRDRQQHNQEFNAEVNKQILDADRLKEQSINLGIAISKIDDEIVRLQEQRKIKANELKATNEHIAHRGEPEKPVDVFTYLMPAPPTYTDLSDLDNELATASQTNALAMEFEQRKLKIKQKMEKELSYNKLTEEIETLRSEKIGILKNTVIPVPGLEIKEMPEGGYGLFSNDIYSENWSEAEGLMIASQLCISQNPKLRAVFLDKGESMDSETLKAYSKWAEENSLQAIITIVSDVPDKESMQEGVWYIEDGNIVTKEAPVEPGQATMNLE